MKRFISLLCVFVIWAFVVNESNAVDADQWIYRQLEDDLTGKQFTKAARFFGNNADAVMFQCSDEGFLVVIDVGGYLNSKFEPVPVRYRIDKAPMVSTTWKTGIDGTSTWTSDVQAARFARGLMSGKKLVLEATAYDSDTHRIRVDLVGSAGPIRKVLADCGQ